MSWSTTLASPPHSLCCFLGLSHPAERRSFSNRVNLHIAHVSVVASTYISTCWLEAVSGLRTVPLLAERNVDRMVDLSTYSDVATSRGVPIGQLPPVTITTSHRCSISPSLRHNRTWAVFAICSVSPSDKRTDSSQRTMDIDEHSWPHALFHVARSCPAKIRKEHEE